MKRKVLSVLSVFMSVLISTAALAGCEKTPAGDNGGSGESAIAAEGGEESGTQIESEPEENFDYTGWQDFSYEMGAVTCEIYSVEGRMMFGGTSPAYSATVNFKLPEDFKILQDVYGDEFHAGTKFDFYPLDFYITKNDDLENVRNIITDGNENVILFPRVHIVPADFSEPWYDYLVVKEARGDPDWMSAYHYDIYAEIDGGIFHAVVNEYGAFDENYDMSNAIAFIRQVTETVSVTVDYDSQS